MEFKQIETALLFFDGNIPNLEEAKLSEDDEYALSFLKKGFRSYLSQTWKNVQEIFDLNKIETIEFKKKLKQKYGNQFDESIESSIIFEQKDRRKLFVLRNKNFADAEIHFFV